MLWAKVVDEVKKVNKDLKIDRNIAQRKFSNLLITYKRIKKRNNTSGRESTSWLHYEDFDEVYGTRHSINLPTQNLQSSVELPMSILTEPNDDFSNGFPQRPVLAVNQTGVKAAFKYFIKHLIKNTDATGYQKVTSKVDQFIRK